VPGPTQIVLQRPTGCAQCGTALAVGSLASWDQDSGTVLCANCTLAASGPNPLFTGIAGNSAQREYERRKQRDRAANRRRLPLAVAIVIGFTVVAYVAVQGALGAINHATATHVATTPAKHSITPSAMHSLGILAALVAGIAVSVKIWGRRQTTEAWAIGAAGERRVGKRLEEASAHGVIVLHDRRPPGVRWNIDHIAIGPAGIFVIDVKVIKGKVETRRTGSLFRPGPTQLRVGGRDRSDFLSGMSHQVQAVAHALGAAASQVPIQSMIVLDGATWGLFARPLVVSHVWVGWAKAASQAVRHHGPLEHDVVLGLAAALNEQLRPA